MRFEIPGPLMVALSDALAATHTGEYIDRIFMQAGATGPPPPGSKAAKSLTWLRQLKDDDAIGDPLAALGRLLEPVLDQERGYWASEDAGKKVERLQKSLTEHGLQYLGDGRITSSLGTPTRTLRDIIAARDARSIQEEFDRALESVGSNPREAVSAASNILEAICKTFIEDEGLEMPANKDLSSTWSIVRKRLGFDPAAVQDDDLKQLLSGLISTVAGIGGLRTHASSAHGSGRTRYKLEVRHARLAVHAAHTVAAFVLESWDSLKQASSA